MRRKLLLDVGCGEGKCCIDFAKKGYDVVGIEKDSATFKKAKLNVDKSGVKKFIKIYNKDIREVNLNKKFDGVLFNYILMFMSEKEAQDMIDEFYKKLKKRGEMLIRILMFDDPIAINVRQRKKFFYPSYDKMKKLKRKYKGELEFRLLRDKPHGKNKFSHIHSVGILKIVKNK